MTLPAPSYPHGVTHHVSLVGAGPGDPELLTLKAHRLLQQADVVLYDNLVHPRILGFCQPETQLIFVGKVPGAARTSQAEINALLVHHAQRGVRVVRLKGGDPFVFGRGGEEALALAEAGICCNIIPGISSCIAAPAQANIPVTHRHVTTHFSVVTGVASKGGEEALRQAWHNLGRAKGTVVFLMAVRQLEEIVEVLLKSGRSPDTPTALVQQGTTSSQRTLEAPLGQIATLARTHNIQPPATFIVGDVVNVRQKLTLHPQLHPQGLDTDVPLH